MIPVSTPLIGDLEEELVVDCIRTGWISSEGQYVKDFEKSCATYAGVKHGIAVSNGTTALKVALECLDLNEGDEVIMPTFTIISCALAIIEVGAIPVLVDSDPETWCMDVNQIEAKITSKTKAIMAVHMYGHPVDMDPILELAKKYNLFTIEDNAESHGSEYKGKKCGGISDISIHSFYANKLVTTGEGGMVLTNSDLFADKARSLRNLCFRSDRRFYHTEIGHNYRMTNIQAAIGLAQMKRLEGFVLRKREMAQMYNEAFKDLPLQLPVNKEWAKNNYWMYSLLLNDEVSADAEVFTKKLIEQGVESRLFFMGMHEQPVLQKLGLFKGEAYPISERMTQRGFYIPSGQAITNDQIKTVIRVVKETIREFI